MDVGDPGHQRGAVLPVGTSTVTGSRVRGGMVITLVQMRLKCIVSMKGSTLVTTGHGVPGQQRHLVPKTTQFVASKFNSHTEAVTQTKE